MGLCNVVSVAIFALLASLWCSTFGRFMLSILHAVRWCISSFHRPIGWLVGWLVRYNYEVFSYRNCLMYTDIMNCSRSERIVKQNFSHLCIGNPLGPPKKADYPTRWKRFNVVGDWRRWTGVVGYVWCALWVYRQCVVGFYLSSMRELPFAILGFRKRKLFRTFRIPLFWCTYLLFNYTLTVLPETSIYYLLMFAFSEYWMIMDRSSNGWCTKLCEI